MGNFPKMNLYRAYYHLSLLLGVMSARNVDKIAASVLIHQMMLNFDIDQSGQLGFTGIIYLVNVEFLAATLDRKLFITEKNITTTF